VAFFTQYSHATQPARFEPTTSSSRVTSSITAPYSHLCLYSVFFSNIYYTKLSINWLCWGPKKIKIKKLSTTKFYNFFEICNFHFDSFNIRGHLRNLNFQFEKFKLSFLLIRWFQIKKLSTTKFYNFSGSATLILVVSPTEILQKNQISNFCKFKISFGW